MEPQDRTLLPNFTAVALKMWPTAPKIAKIVIFDKKITPLEKFWGSIGKLEHR